MLSNFYQEQRMTLCNNNYSIIPTYLCYYHDIIPSVWLYKLPPLSQAVDTFALLLIQRVDIGHPKIWSLMRVGSGYKPKPGSNRSSVESLWQADKWKEIDEELQVCSILLTVQTNRCVVGYTGTTNSEEKDPAQDNFHFMSF